MATVNATFAALCPHVDADYVKDILAPVGTELTDAQINIRINQAWAIVGQLTGQLGDCGGNDTLCEIAALLAAHFVTVSERQTSSESVASEWSVKYMGEDGLGLNSSLYGQNAVQMDCSGTLEEIVQGVKRTGFKIWDQTDIDDVTRR